MRGTATASLGRPALRRVAALGHAWLGRFGEELVLAERAIFIRIQVGQMVGCFAQLTLGDRSVAVVVKGLHQWRWRRPLTPTRPVRGLPGFSGRWLWGHLLVGEASVIIAVESGE